jgi:NADPH:quinone reductase-like Zn-dependent oxidoreductase
MAPQKQRGIFVTTLDADKVKGFNNLELRETDVPQLKDGQVLVRVTVRCINPTDTYQARGDYGHKPPFVPGAEAVGVVEELGPGTSGRLSRGQRVVAADWGQVTYQEYVAVDEKNLAAVPDDMNDEIAAQIFITTLTVVGMVETAAVPKGEYLLQAAAASGLGRQLIQYCKHKGIKTINVVRRQEQIEELKALGADEVINSQTEDVVARVKEITGGKGAYSALDPVAGYTTSDMLAGTRAGGTAIWYGWLGEPVQHIRIPDFFNKTLTNFIIYTWLPAQCTERIHKLFEEGFEMFRSGVLKVLPGQRFQFEDYKAALEASVAPGRGPKSPKVFLESK